MLVENMQRGVLQGNAPVAIAVESEKSILARWKTLLGTTLKRKHHEKAQHDAISPQTQEAQNYALDQRAMEDFRESHDESQDRIISDEIVQMLSQIVQGNMSDELLAQFFELSQHGNSSDWRAGFGEIKIDATKKTLLFKAIQLCREDDKMEMMPNASLKELRNVLSGG